MISYIQPDEELLWIDEYDSSGWAVLNYDTLHNETIHAKQIKVIDTDLTKRSYLKIWFISISNK